MQQISAFARSVGREGKGPSLLNFSLSNVSLLYVNIKHCNAPREKILFSLQQELLAKSLIFLNRELNGSYFTKKENYKERQTLKILSERELTV